MRASVGQLPGCGAWALVGAGASPPRASAAADSHCIGTSSRLRAGALP